MENNLKRLWTKDKPSTNIWMSSNSPFCAEVLAETGFDSLTVDLQHGLNDYRDMLSIFQAIGRYPICPMVRVPWLDPQIIMKSLDAGSMGVICPMINTTDQAQEFVSYMRYPPVGERSYGPTRALYSTEGSYWQRANTEILALAMIETKEAYGNISSIVKTKGLSGVYIGPSDLSIGLSNGELSPGMDRTEREIEKAIKNILHEAKRANIFSGIHCATAEYAAKAIKWGFNMVTLNSETRLLGQIASGILSKTRTLIE